MNTNTIHTGDAFDVLPDLPDQSVHAVVTDPPYGLAFMGRDWDDFKPKEYQEWCEEWARECKRVLKPGGHLLAFSGNRTHHRLFTGVEDAGFEIRDTLTWHYGSGFPKASDVSKTIDKRADAEREVVGQTEKAKQVSDESRAATAGKSQSGETVHAPKSEPATDAAKKWDGWKTGLKPATEFVVMARKPYDGATVDSVLENGTGALNIDACRITTDDDLSGGATTDKPRESDLSGDNRTDAGKGMFSEGSNPDIEPAEGRYPANVVFDEAAADALDREVGELAGCARTPQTGTGRNTSDAPTRNDPDERIELESGGPSRYFYTSKASRSERTEGGAIQNDHPTVKPIDLMEWLIKLVTREGQVVLDPFAGSGTTCKAAKALNREFVGIERQAKWADVARVRCGLSPDDPSVVREDGQGGLDEW